MPEPVPEGAAPTDRGAEGSGPPHGDTGAAPITRPGGITHEAAAEGAADKPLAPTAATPETPAPVAPSPDEMVPASLTRDPGAPGPALPRGAARPVLTIPDERLRQIAAPAAELPWPELAPLAADLLATLYAAGGRGLAAPQIGVARRIFVMDAGWKSGPPRPRIVIDPEILDASAEIETVREECLSIPGRPVAVARPAAIRLRWFTLDGEAVVSDWTGIEARIALHEIDHLNGILITDHEKAP